MADGSSAGHDELVYESAGLPKTTNWWGAFVIGLAGTILVTGIAPVMVTELGAASVPVIVLITISGYIVCLLLAELSALMARDLPVEQLPQLCLVKRRARHARCYSAANRTCATDSCVVIAGHSPSKTGVNALVTRQSIFYAKGLLAKRMDARVKPGHDESSL